MTKKLFALWEYDQFPFVLGGEITDMNSNGRVQVKNYGKGYWFTPFKIVPLEDGKRILQQLSVLTDQKISAEHKLGNDFLRLRNAIIQIPTNKKS